MQKIQLTVTSPSFSQNQYLQDLVRKTFPGTKLNFSGSRLEGKSLIDFVGGANALIVGLEKIDADFLNSCPEIIAISKFGVGVDNIDLDECKKRGVRVFWEPGVNRLSVAEMVIGFMLMLCRNLYVCSNQVKNGTWIKNGGHQLSGKVVGIIGFGSIGQEVARLLAPFKCQILANDIIEIEQTCRILGAKSASKDEIFSNSDIVTIHTPLTHLTRNMANLERFHQMKPSAFIINTSRGGIVNQQHLKEALNEKLIAGAALDVFEKEPETDKTLLELENLITTPHTGGNAKEAVQAMGESAIANLRNFLKL